SLPNHQRLEFLGDAVLDLVAAAYWARRTFQHRPDAMRAMSVSNVALGAMCLRSGLYQHIRYRGRSDPTSTFDSARAKLLCVERGAAPYMLDFKVSKVLADVVEGVFGAVFMDSGCRYEVVHPLFMRLLEPKLRHLGGDAGGGWRIIKSRKK
ncbi:Dicer-like protein 1, partial [Dissophora globulifera]